MADWYLKVGENVGIVLTHLAAVLATLIPVAVVWDEYYAIPGVVVSMAIVYGVGKVLVTFCTTADDPSEAQVFASAATAWLAAAIAGTLPFLTVAWTVALDPAFVAVPASASDPTLRAFQTPVNAWFESMSGFTGSGLTMARKESNLPATLQWWRSLMQWIGGLGVIVLTIAIVNKSESSMLFQYYEDRSPLGQFQNTDVSNAPALLTAVFAAVTLLAIALFWVVGMPPWPAINHGMTGLATGGFVVTDSSFKAYDAAIRTAALPVMFVGAIPLPAYYLLFRLDLEAVYTDIQVRWFSVAVLAGTLTLIGILVDHAEYTSFAETGLRATFQFVSAITCTGFYTVSSIGQAWPANAVLLLTAAMGLGGAAGSTASGVKIIRAISVSRGLRSIVRDPFPDQELPESIDESVSGRYASANYRKASVVVLLWLAAYLLGVFALLATLPSAPDVVSVQNALFTVASAQGNVGLTSGIATPSTPMMPAPAKLALTANMWIGRLEIIPVLVLLRVLFWEYENDV